MALSTPSSFAAARPSTAPAAGRPAVPTAVFGGTTRPASSSAQEQPTGAASRALRRPLPWAVGGAAACGLVLLAGQLLVLGPQDAATQAVRDQVAQTEATEAALTSRVTELKVQYAGLAEYQAELARAQAQIPADAALPELVRAVRAAAASSGVDLTGLVPQAPTAFGQGTTGAAAPATGDAAATGGTVETTPSTDPTAAAADPAAAAGTSTVAAVDAAGTLVQVPVSITATGSYASMKAFLASLQQQSRLVLLTGVALAPQETTDAGQELTLTATGSVFALPSSAPTSPTS